MTIDWQSLLVTSTAAIVRTRRIPDDTGTGVLWSVNPQEVLKLSALEVMAWEGREVGLVLSGRVQSALQCRADILRAR